MTETPIVLKLTPADRDRLVAYATARKMPKTAISAYASGASDATPLAQLVAAARVDWEQKVAEATAAGQTKLSAKEAELDAANSTVETVLTELSRATGLVGNLRADLQALRGLAGGLLVRASKVKAIVDRALAR